MDYKFVKYNSSYLSSLSKLLDSCFGIAGTDKERTVEWKYYDDYLKNKTITYLALDSGNNVVSQYTNLPITITSSGTDYQCMICADMCTDVHHRGKGLISTLSKKVYADVQKANYDFSLGFSTDEGVKVDKYASDYGYKIVGTFARYFQPLLFKKRTSYLLKEVATFDTDFYDATSHYFKIKKDYNYVTWRYVQKPGSVNNFYLIINNDKTIGYVIMKFSGYRCYVHEIICQDEHVSEVLKSIENIALEHNVRLLIYHLLDNSFWKALFKGKIVFKTTNNTTNYYLTIKIHNTKINVSQVLNSEKWLLMNGDIM